jgi:formate hydrogenlyase transcriptional activator
MVQDRHFRADLYYRLNVFPICLPPLRDRSGDIPSLVRHFVRKSSKRLHRNIEYIPDEVMDVLKHYDWPGNIRELQNVLECAAILCEGDTFSIDETILKRDIPQRPNPAIPLAMTIADREREIIEAALAECGGRVAGPKGAAAKLGIPRQTLDSKIATLNIEKRRFQTFVVCTTSQKLLLLRCSRRYFGISECSARSSSASAVDSTLSHWPFDCLGSRLRVTGQRRSSRLPPCPTGVGGAVCGRLSALSVSWFRGSMARASSMRTLTSQLRKAPSYSNRGGLRDAVILELSTTSSTRSGPPRIRPAR